MIRCMQRKFAASFIVFSLIICPAAFAAAEDSPSSQEKPAQAEPEAKSYLPPWMQSQGSGENPGAPAANGTQANNAATAADDDAAKKKVPASNQGRKSHRHGSSPDNIISGFVGLFGR